MAKRVFISSTLPREAVGLIPRDFTLDYNNSEVPLSKAELVSRLKGKDGLICHIISTIDEEVLASAPTLKVVANVAVGYNNIDVAAARRRGVIVTNTPDVLTETTADFAWTLLMASARRIVEADHYARSGRWTAWKWDLLWGRHSRQDARHRGVRADRARRRPPRARVQDARPLPRRREGRRRRRAGALRDRDRSRDAPARGRLCDAP